MTAEKEPREGDANGFNDADSDDDSLRAFIADCDRHVALAVKCQPECAERSRGIAQAKVKLEEASRGAVLGCSATREDAGADDNASEASTVSLFETCVREATPRACAISMENVNERCARTGTRLWRTTDAIVFVACCETKSDNVKDDDEEDAFEDVFEDASDAMDAEKSTSKTVSTQWPEMRAGFKTDAKNITAFKALKGTSALERVDEIARATRTMEEDNVFVVCENVGENDQVRAAKIRDAFVKLCGVREKHVFCVPNRAGDGLRLLASLESASSNAGGGGGWFSSAAAASPKRTTASEFAQCLKDWHREWREKRVLKFRDEEYLKWRAEVQFWAAFLREDDEWREAEKERLAAKEEGEENGEEKPKDDDEKDFPSPPVEDKQTLARLHETASLTTIHKFLATAIEGVPMAGIDGAPEMAWKHFQNYPEPERAPLMKAVYSHNVIQYAAALMFAWLTPGPIGAHATHFMNRFRICLFFACLSGASPLDPTVVATAIGLAAGTSKENLEMSPVIAYVVKDDSCHSDDEDAFDDVAESTDEASNATMDIDGEKTTPEDDDTSWMASFDSLSTMMQDALNRAISEGNDLKKRASDLLADFLNSGNRVVLKSRRRAMKRACDAKAAALTEKKMSYEDAEKMAKDVFNATFSREVARNVTSLICGPKFLVAVQADLTQVINSSFTTYIAASSMDIFLPMVEEHEAKMQEKRDEAAKEAAAVAAAAAAAATAALTVKDGFIKVSVCYVEDEHSKGDVRVRCQLTPTPKPKMVDQLLSTSRLIGEKTAALTSSTATAVTSSAEAVSSWATKTSDSIAKETNRSIERAQESAKVGLEKTKHSLEHVGAFFDRTKSSLNETIASSATSLSSAFSSSFSSSAAVGSVSIDVRSLPAQRVAAALENEQVDRVIVDSKLVLKMPPDLVLSKGLAEIYKEVREDSSAFLKYKDDETVLRAIQRLLELVVESGDEEAINALIKLGVVPRPKSQAQVKLEALRERFRQNGSAEADNPQNAPANSDTTEPPAPEPSSSSIPSPSELASKVTSRLSSISFTAPTLNFFSSNKPKSERAVPAESPNERRDDDVVQASDAA